MRVARPGPAPGEEPELVAAVAALERTALSWERTAISLAALGTVVLKFVEAGPLVRAGGLVMIASAIVLILLVVPLGYRRARAQVLHHGPSARLHREDALVRAVLMATAGVVVLTAAFAAAEVLLLA